APARGGPPPHPRHRLREHQQLHDKDAVRLRSRTGRLPAACSQGLPRRPYDPDEHLPKSRAATVRGRALRGADSPRDRPRTMRSAAVLACLLALAGVYLLYLPHAGFVLDDWFLFQHFAKARLAGPEAQWKLAAALVQNTVWGSFRTNGLSFLF